MSTDLKQAKALTLTYLTPVSFASLNGGDKEADNMVNIKKLTRETEQGPKAYPYVSSQAVRRALRERLADLGCGLSEGVAATQKKGAATTLQDPKSYIDDDLFGYMEGTKGEGGAKGGTKKRTSPVRVSPLLAMDAYQGDLDFGTNYMSVKAGGDPNIFETEIHSGLYRGTILIELDRVGCGEGFEKGELEKSERAKRVSALLTAVQNLWTSGRQSRFLADISPKFVAAAATRVKTPIFLESVRLHNGGLQTKVLSEVVADHGDMLIAHTYGARSETFHPVPEGTVTVGEAFKKMQEWVAGYYGA
ncbi:MAG: type I-B CRISPR-associated protein Cas7/Cst2/DevR [Nitrospira sp.]|nr:type I-B CRISPR-associated protein Cas7/Cst2/DevR [Nitrospira sp.]